MSVARRVKQHNLQNVAGNHLGKTDVMHFENQNQTFIRSVFILIGANKVPRKTRNKRKK